MQKANKFVFVSFLMLCLTAHAQTQPSTTLNQAIEVIKARKALELDSTAQAFSQTAKVEAKAITNKKNTAKNSLELWAIHGLGNDLRAEVVFQGQIKELSFASEKLRIGNWFLVGLSDHEAEFSALSSDGKLSSQKIRLKLSQPTELAAIWPNVISEGMSSADGTLRPPVPMSMLKP